ncbi:site-specific tyrosine recombinase XerD [Mycetocola tolaasinivorans]|uniref:Tyrosine recombinase XerD n=1 Tax=Mycetocola tolaasinivorans TaxID=76635 RepID=A0A3L6ZZ54_9MICO|nr:site-specific tyrosine recombinase XerD [Mycetocola tolaasinivorans]RLP73313.1 site-specific tyrosine recombinase XerD [Mycetocola tolaasinivorans]
MAADRVRQLENYLRHLTIERGRSTNTLLAYRRDLTRYLAWLDEREVTDLATLSAEDIAHFGRSLSESGLAAASVARILSAVRGWHRFLLEEGDLDRDIAREVLPPKLPSRLPKALRIDEVEALLAAVSGDDPQSLRDRALLELLYATGARVSEAVDLNVDDVIDGDILRLRGKGNKERIVPVGSYARAALDAYLVRARPIFSARGFATPALFLGARGSRVSRQNAWLIIRRAAEHADIASEVSPHSLRHSFATHLMQGGADVRVVQELLGHSSVATTQIYTRVSADSLREMFVQAHPRAR